MCLSVSVSVSVCGVSPHDESSKLIAQILQRPFKLGCLWTDPASPPKRMSLCLFGILSLCCDVLGERSRSRSARAAEHRQLAHRLAISVEACGYSLACSAH